MHARSCAQSCVPNAVVTATYLTQYNQRHCIASSGATVPQLWLQTRGSAIRERLPISDGVRRYSARRTTRSHPSAARQRRMHAGGLRLDQMGRCCCNRRCVVPCPKRIASLSAAVIRMAWHACAYGVQHDLTCRSKSCEVHLGTCVTCARCCAVKIHLPHDLQRPRCRHTAALSVAH